MVSPKSQFQQCTAGTMQGVFAYLSRVLNRAELVQLRCSSGSQFAGHAWATHGRTSIVGSHAQSATCCIFGNRVGRLHASTLAVVAFPCRFSHALMGVFVMIILVLGRMTAGISPRLP